MHLKSDIISLDGGGVYFYGANQLSHNGSIASNCYYDGYTMGLIYELNYLVVKACLNLNL